jgi:GNAT superfamily N-acetyltransferase
VFFGNIDGAEVRLLGSSCTGITGGPTADFNMGLFDAGLRDEAGLEEFVDRVNALGLPAAALISSSANRRLGPIAAIGGLVEAGAAPLMALSAGSGAAPTTDFTVTRVRDSTGMAVFADLAASAFGLDREWVGRTFAAPSMLEGPGLEFFVASRGDVPMSGVTTTGMGETVGIWTMSTPPDKQRQGAGRAVLMAAIDYHRTRGAKTFYLCATPAGKPLYDRVGFTTVDELTIWVAGTSAQFEAHGT